MPSAAGPAGSLTFAPHDLQCDGLPPADFMDQYGPKRRPYQLDPPMHLLTAIPVYNEEDYLQPVLTEVLRYAGDVLVVDDGSTDRTPELLRAFPTVRTIRHPRNLGYGAGLRTAFRAAIEGGLRRAGDARLRRPARAVADPRPGGAAGATPTSSRAAATSRSSTRRNGRPRSGGGSTSRSRAGSTNAWDLNVTDAFCGFKAYRTSALRAVRHHRQRLCHAASGVGPGRRPRDDDRGGRGPPDLPGRVAGLRRCARRRRVTGWPIIARCSRRRSIERGSSPREGVWDDGTPPARPRDRRRLAGRTRPGPRSAASPRSNADRLSGWDYDVQGRQASRLRDLARREIVHLAREFLRRHGLERRARPSLESPGSPQRPPGRDRAPAGAVPSRRLGQELRGVRDRPLVRGDRAQPDRRQRYPQGLIDPRPGRPRRAASARCRSSSIDGRARSPTRTGRSAMSRCSRRSPTGCARSSAARSPTRCSTTSGRGRPGAAARSHAIGLRFSLARREIEASWGVTNLELPLGLLCQTDSFLWFASHLIAQLPRYQQVHNDCLAEYRAAHRIRSRHHPVAALGQDG